MVKLGGGNDVGNHDNVLKSLHERTLSHYNAMSHSKDNNLYWISPSQQRPDIGYLYMLTPKFSAAKSLLSALVLFSMDWLFECKMFLPAEDNAFRLEEHEQFNRKIVASAPVGICILRIRDGTNILSNELAHNYINLLTYEDRERLCA